MQPFTQQQEEKGNPEISPVQAENPETVESVPEVVSKDEIHIEERPFGANFAAAKKEVAKARTGENFAFPYSKIHSFELTKLV